MPPLLHYVEVQLRYDRQGLVHKGKGCEAVARLRTRASKARQVMLRKDWIIQPSSRQLVPGWVAEDGAKTDSEWIIEPSKLLLERDHVLVARTLCQQKQIEAEIPVELYNPSDESVQLYSRMTLGLLTPIQDLFGESQWCVKHYSWQECDCRTARRNVETSGRDRNCD